MRISDWSSDVCSSDLRSVASSSSCSVFVARELSASWCLGPGHAPARGGGCGSVSRRPSSGFDVSAVGIVVGEAMRAEEDGEGAVGILVDPDPGLDEMWPERARRELQMQTVPFDGVVVADPALVLNAPALAPSAGQGGSEGRAGLPGVGGHAGRWRRARAPGEPRVGRPEIPAAGPTG